MIKRKSLIKKESDDDEDFVKVIDLASDEDLAHEDSDTEDKEEIKRKIQMSNVDMKVVIKINDSDYDSDATELNSVITGDDEALRTQIIAEIDELLVDMKTEQDLNANFGALTRSNRENFHENEAEMMMDDEIKIFNIRMESTKIENSCENFIDEKLELVPLDPPADMNLKIEADVESYEDLDMKSVTGMNYSHNNTVNENNLKKIPQSKEGPERHQDNKAPTEMVCDICGYKTKHRSNFNRHMKLHLKYGSQAIPRSNQKGKGMQKCPNCPYRTKNSSHLKQHVKIHDKNRERPYKCDHEECSYATDIKRSLTRHKESHKKCGKRSKNLDKINPKFKCPRAKCNREFKRQSNLSAHLIYHDDPAQLTCDACEAVFTEKGSLYRHLRNTKRCPVKAKAAGKNKR